MSLKSSIESVPTNYGAIDDTPGEDAALLGAEPVNPFLNGTPKITSLEIIKMILMSPVALFRILLCLLAVLFLSLWSVLATIGHPKDPSEDTHDFEPAGPIRRFFLSPLQFFARVILWCMGYLWVHETGCCACFNPCAGAPAPAPVIVCNHVSIIEPLYLIYKFLPCGAGMADLAKWPLLGSVFLASTPIAIDRTSAQGRSRAAIQMKLRPKSSLPFTKEDEQGIEEKEAKLKSMPNSTEKEKEAYEKLKYEIKLERAYLKRRAEKAVPYPPLMVYPEGTTTSDKFLLQFKAGAFMSGQPVQPVVVSYPYCNLDVTWSCDVALGKMIGRLFFQVWNCMTVHYLPVYIPDEAEKEDAQLYADNVRKVMAQAMVDSPVHANVVMTEHSYEDTRLLAKAQQMYKASNPGITTDIPYSQIRSKHHLSMDQTMQLLEAFSDADDNGDGEISFEEFAKAMGLDATDPTTYSYFHMMDSNGSGEVNFREFLQGIVVGNEQMSKEDKLKVVFQIYDANGDGSISREEVLAIVESHKFALRNSTEEVETQKQIQRTTSTLELVDKVMGAQEAIDFAAFQQLVETHPELMDFALNRVQKWNQNLQEEHATPK